MPCSLWDLCSLSLTRDQAWALSRKSTVSQALACSDAKSLQSCPSLCDPVDCSCQAPPSLGFSRQYWSGLPRLQDIFLRQGWNPYFLCLLRWQVGSLPLAPPGKPQPLDCQGILRSIFSKKQQMRSEKFWNSH